jgi:hypothetical protein
MKLVRWFGMRNNSEFCLHGFNFRFILSGRSAFFSNSGSSGAVKRRDSLSHKTAINPRQNHIVWFKTSVIVSSLWAAQRIIIVESKSATDFGLKAIPG